MALIEMSDFAQAAWRLKFDRANLLLSEFGTELKGYLSNNPTETVIEDWDGTTLKVRLRIRVQSDPKWSVLIGDIIHNFRSSLDSLLFSIIAYKASEVGETLSKELQRTIAFPFRTRANQMKSVPGLFQYGDRVLIQDITEAQPFSHLKDSLEPSKRKIIVSGHPLYLLQQLSNRDKHQTINLMYCYLDFWAVGHDAGLELLSVKEFPRNSETNEYVFQFNFSGGNVHSQPSFLPEFRIGIEDPSGMKPQYAVDSLLLAIGRQVGYLIHKLEYHLRPKPWNLQ